MVGDGDSADKGMVKWCRAVVSHSIAMSSSPSPSSLTINNIGNAGAPALAEALKTNTALTMLQRVARGRGG